MENIFNIVRIIMGITELSIFVMLLDTFFIRKEINKKLRNSIFLAFCIIFHIMAINIPASPIKIFIAIGINTIFASMLYENIILRKLVISILYMLGMVLIEGMTVMFLPQIQHMQTEDLIIRNTIGILMGIIVNTVLFLIVNIINRIMNQKNIKFNLFELLVYALPVSTIGISIVILNYQTNQYNNLVQLIWITFSIMGLFVTSVFIWKTFEKIINQDREKRQYIEVQEKIKKQYLYYRNIETKQEESKKMWHDINNHLSCIKLLIDSGHADQASEYVNKIDATISRLRGVINTGNVITDAILNEKYDYAKNNHIEMRIDINLETIDFIESMDLCTIYSNLVDNAIEASIKLPEDQREIIIYSKVIKSCLVIKILNNTLENVEIKNNKIATSKKDKNNHGIGLMNICETIDKYNGNIAMNCENKKFTTNIMIPLKK